MRGQSKMKRINRGQTIVAEREHVESESERMQARKRLHRKRVRSVTVAALMLAVLGLLAYTTGRGYVQEMSPSMKDEDESDYVIKAKIVDEDNRGQISTRMKTYIAQLERDLRDLGYTVTQVVLPTGTSRELYVDLAGEKAYLKVNLDRDAAMTAEDADRVLKYLKEKELEPGYIDVRVEGKAYYK